MRSLMEKVMPRTNAIADVLFLGRVVEAIHRISSRPRMEFAKQEYVWNILIVLARIDMPHTYLM